LAITLIGLCENQSRGAIPPSEYIIRKVAARRTGIKWLKLGGTVLASLDESGAVLENPAGFLKLKSLTVVDLTTRTLHVRLQDEAGTSLYEGPLPLEQKKNANQPSLGKWLLEPAAEVLIADLQHAGVPILTQSQLVDDYKTEAERQEAEKTRLSRVDGRVAWVVGKAGTPSAWFEKDTHVPMRFELPTGDARRVLNLKNVKLVQDHPLPRQWVLSLESESPANPAQSGSVLLKEDLTDVSALTDELAKQALKAIKSGGYTTAADALSTQARGAINRYLELFR
jgi:hypothetical protein